MSPDLFKDLPNGYSSKKDRYAEFRKLFMGTDEGKRVYAEILSWGRLFRPSIVNSPVDPLILAVREGERNMALRLLSVVNEEPKEKPTEGRRKV